MKLSAKQGALSILFLTVFHVALVQLYDDHRGTQRRAAAPWFLWAKVLSVCLTRAWYAAVLTLCTYVLLYHALSDLALLVPQKTCRNDDVQIYLCYLYMSNSVFCKVLILYIHISTTILAKPSDVNILSTQLLCVFVHLCTSRQELNLLMLCAVHVLAGPTPTTFSAATDTLS